MVEIYIKIENTIFDLFPRDRKQQMVNRLLDCVADDLRKVSLTKEKKNVL